jgi:putative transposase
VLAALPTSVHAGARRALAEISGAEDREHAEHWVHLKTTNPVESTFATVRLRTRVTKGPAARKPGWRWRSSCSRQPSSAGEP